MGTTEIEKTLFDANFILSRHTGLSCFSVWRSIGSNVFLEFGTPVLKRVTPKTRPAFTVLRGEASIGIHGDHWRLLDGLDTILDSIRIDEATLKRVAEPVLRGTTLPVLSLNGEGTIVLAFERRISIVVEKSDYPDEATASEFDEITVNLPGAAFSFNYERGFYQFDEPTQQ
jgi:hypothetical protein